MPHYVEQLILIVLYGLLFVAAGKLLIFILTDKHSK